MTSFCQVKTKAMLILCSRCYAGASGSLLWASAFAAACKDHEFCRVGKFDHPMSEHGRRKIRVWQAACSLVVFVPSEETEKVIFRIFDMLVVRNSFPSWRLFFFDPLTLQKLFCCWDHRHPQHSEYQNEGILITRAQNRLSNGIAGRAAWTSQSNQGENILKLSLADSVLLTCCLSFVLMPLRMQNCCEFWCLCGGFKACRVSATAGDYAGLFIQEANWLDLELPHPKIKRLFQQVSLETIVALPYHFQFYDPSKPAVIGTSIAICAEIRVNFLVANDCKFLPSAHSEAYSRKFAL